ncbi:MAG TPA: hypothetical protein VEC38_06345 [Candidatus Binataceae bacterium]|nr:hypothetical protein [Candidatus Binataceae bacterium]
MADGDTPEPEEWHLGIEPGEHREAVPPPEVQPEPTVDLSAARLDRPLYVLTAEHLGWIIIAVYAIASRMIALGARPLSPAESRAALGALTLARDGIGTLSAHPEMHLTWIEVAQVWIFSLLGASDWTARLAFALCGLLLVATALAMRPYAGRAGALALAAMLALSPSITWFSRSGEAAVPALAFAMAAIALMLSISHRPTMLRAVGLGCASGIALASGPVGAGVMATAAIALGMAGAWIAITGADTWLAVRVWWTRRRLLVIVAAAATIAVWWLFESLFFATSAVGVITDELRSLAQGATPWSLAGAAAFYAPMLGFYEFGIVIVALAGLVAVVGGRVRSRFAAWTLLWTLASVGAILALPAHRTEMVVAMCVPMALLGACGVEWLHHSPGWSVARYAAAAIGALTLYGQVLTNVVYAAPDASEAPWHRHAVLFWTDPATTIQAPAECAHAEASIEAADRSAAVSDDLPEIQWYLRDSAATDAASATIVAAPAPRDAGLAEENLAVRVFGVEETWSPDLHALTPGAAVRYLFTAQAWSAIEIRDAELRVQASAKSSAPTVIVAPPSQPSPVPSPSPTPAAP